MPKPPKKHPRDQYPYNAGTDIECGRCKARINGQRCKKITCKTHPYCWQHLVTKMNLRVKESRIPNTGQGLFAQGSLSRKRDNKTVVFSKGDVIAEYTAPKKDVITQQELMRRYPGDTPSPYVLTINKNKHVDGRSTKASVGRYSNDCRAKDSKDGKCKINAKFAFNSKLGVTRIVALRDIHNDEEIFTSYGPEYWK